MPMPQSHVQNHRMEKQHWVQLRSRCAQGNMAHRLLSLYMHGLLHVLCSALCCVQQGTCGSLWCCGRQAQQFALAGSQLLLSASMHDVCDSLAKHLQQLNTT